MLEENQNILHKICRLYTADREAHQDLFQEMVIQLWRSYPKFKGHSKFSTWAYRIALNTAISLFRVSNRKPKQVDWDNALEQVRYEEYDPEQEEKLSRLYATIRTLNDIEKALVFMYLEEKEYSEIAETLGITEVNARVKMNRIKTKLRVLLKKGEE